MSKRRLSIDITKKFPARSCLNSHSLDELSSYHDEDEEVDGFDSSQYNNITMHSQYPPEHPDPNWILEENYNDDEAYDEGVGYNHHHRSQYVDGHGNYYSPENPDEEYYDENYHNDYDCNDNDTLTDDHDLEYPANYIPNAQDDDDGMSYNNSTATMEKSYYERRQRKRRQKRMVWGLVLGCCCIISVAAVLVVVFVVLLPSKENDKSDASLSLYDQICVPFQSTSDTAELCTTLVQAIVPVHPNRTLPHLYTPVPTSCQFLTLDWLIGTIGDDVKIIRSVSRIRQRYSFGVFHCELYTSAWFTLDLHLTGDNNECTWSTSDLTDPITDIVTLPCNGNNDIQILRIISGNDIGGKNNDAEEQLPLRGTLPPELSMLTSLKEITLMNYANNLFGTIPPEYNILTTLEIFKLSSNALNGTLPSFIYNIHYVDVSNNTLTGPIPTRPSVSTKTTQQNLRMSSSSPSRSKPSDVDNYDTDDYYYHRHRGLQNKNGNSTGGIPKLLLLHINQLSGSLSLVDIIRPGLEFLTVHSNLLTGLVSPPTLDQSRNLKKLTMYDNNITGNMNVLCPLSTSNGGILSTFAVDMDDIICSCCTNNGDTYDNVFGNISPTISVPKIPPPTIAPKVTTAPSTLHPTVLNVPTASPTLATANTTNSTLDSKAPTAMPTALSGVIILDPVPTSNINVTTYIPTIVSVFVPLDNGINDTTTAPIDSNFTTRRPFRYITTTKMEPFKKDCYFSDNVQPHVLTQCHCFNTIQVLTDDIVGLYAQVRETIYNEVYKTNQNHPFINETIDSCSAQNQALVWLSNGNVRDGGDLFQRYILALFYIQTNGTDWYNASNWLTYQNECDWYGIKCSSITSNSDNLQIRSIQLDGNHIQKKIPEEIYYLSTLQTISLQNNQLSGTIPSSVTLQSLPYIQHFLLSNNSLTGTVPSLVTSPTVTATPVYLKAFELATNYMYGTIPDWLFTNSLVSMTLERLSLHSNVLSGTIPTSIGSTNTSTLQYLYLHNNQLSGTIPTTIGELSQLKEFTVDTNFMTGTVPNDVCQLRTSAALVSLIVESCATPNNRQNGTTNVKGVHCPAMNANMSTCCTSCRT